MEKIILFIIEILFDKVPFSKKAEVAKYKIQHTLENPYRKECTSEKHSMAALEDVIKQTHNIYDADNLFTHKYYLQFKPVWDYFQPRLYGSIISLLYIFT